MIQPSFEEFKKLGRHGNLVAVRLDLRSDLETPVSAFLKLCAKEPNAFLLESAEREERIGRYSFVGFHPAEIVRGRGDKDLVEELRRRLKPYRLVNPEGLPGFAGGFVGYLGYENVGFFERISLREKNGMDVYDAIFFLVKEFLIFDHFKKTLSIICLKDLKGKGGLAELRRAYEEATQRIRAVDRRLVETQLPKVRPRQGVRRGKVISNLSRGEFLKKVRRLKEYIRAGDCIQVVFSQRFHLGRVHDDFEIYRSLRSINPSPYMFYFRCGSLRLIGSSPELLVRKTGRMAEVRPIAGTRPRGKSLAEDLRLEESLRRSPKEMAEHLMLVDLGRNDLGRVCQFKSVRMDEFARVERYSHVMHLVSDVSGRLKAGKDAFDLLKATFPAGTVTGAPKIRAMEIIDELEMEKRGPYAGCLGYFSFNHDMDMCITIRTLAVVENELYVQAGAGIVYDSNPGREYQETVNKARALIQAVQRVSRGDGSRY